MRRKDRRERLEPALDQWQAELDNIVPASIVPSNAGRIHMIGVMIANTKGELDALDKQERKELRDADARTEAEA